jgi:hypothetical protein
MAVSRGPVLPKFFAVIGCDDDQRIRKMAFEGRNEPRYFVIGEPGLAVVIGSNNLFLRRRERCELARLLPSRRVCACIVAIFSEGVGFELRQMRRIDALFGGKQAFVLIRRPIRFVGIDVMQIQKKWTLATVLFQQGKRFLRHAVRRGKRQIGVIVHTLGESHLGREMRIGLHAYGAISSLL